MKRKLLLLIGMVFVMTTMLVCAVGCKKEEAHKHTWSTEWSADGETHWHACTGDGCTAKNDAGNHEGGTATCAEKATCSVCGAKYGELDATNHVSTEFTYVSNGDGTHAKKYACCNAVEVAAEACTGGTATCTEKATCSLCNAKYGELDATNHTETTYRYEANNDGTHKKIHTCCNAVEVAAEACSGGTATCTEKATCSVCGAKYGELDATNHTETTYRYEANNDGTHKKIHTCCNAVEVAAEACSGGTATCTEKATCSLCNAKYGDTIAHTEVIDAAVAATCTEKGKTEGKHCSVCKTVLVAQTEIPAKGHTEVIDAAVAATCTEKGKTEGKHCSVCKTVLVAQTEIPAKGHTEVIDAAVAATCTEKGKTEGKHCSVCKTVLVAQTEIPALGHDYSADWSKDGENHWHECTRCHDKKDIAAHKVSSWKVGETEDTGLCVCGEELDETFEKTVTAKRQDLVVTTYTNYQDDKGALLAKGSDGWYTYTENYNTNASIVLTGVTYESVVSVKYGDALLGNALTGLNLSALTDFAKHGEQNFTVIVKDRYDLEHTITVPVLLVTREISTATEMKILGNLKNYGTNVTISGYYRLANDLTDNGMREYTVSNVTLKNAVFDGNNHKIKLGHWYHYAPGNGLFKNIDGSTIKNLTIDTDYMNKGTVHVVLASEAWGGSVFENITINYIDSTDGSQASKPDMATDTCNTQGFLFASNVESCTFINFTINANNKKIGVLLGRASPWGKGTLDSCKFENFKVLNCAGMGALAWKGTSSDKYMPGDVEGIDVQIVHTHTYTEHEATAATYYEEGMKAYYTCDCGKKFVKNGEEYVEVTDESTLVVAKKKLADDVKGTATAEDVAENDLIKNIVYLEKEGDPTSNKVKVFDQTAPNYVKTTKDGKEVVALYFTKATALTADQGSSNNYGNSEFRISVTGNVAKFSFDYRLVDSNTEKCLTLGESDKGYGMKSFLEYKHGTDYTNVTKGTYGDTLFVADGQWHHVDFECETDDMKAVLFKIYHLQGEFMVTNVSATMAE